MGGGEVAIDLVITDPPYNVGYVGKTKDKKTISNDKMDNISFEEFLTKCFKNMNNVLKETCPFYIWHASSMQSHVEAALNNVGLNVRQQLIWVKNSLVLGRQDYHWRHEPCFYGWKEGKKPHKFYGDRKQTTVLEFNKPSANREHPTIKPLELMSYIIKQSSQENDNILDLFGGSGSTLIACEQTNRNCYMMELDPHYCQVIINRWEEFTGEKAVKISE